MKIAIDVSLAVGESAGVGSYTRGLLEGLAAIDPNNEYILYSYLDFPQSPQPTFPQQPNFSLRMLQLGGNIGSACGLDLTSHLRRPSTRSTFSTALFSMLPKSTMEHSW